MSCSTTAPILFGVKDSVGAKITFGVQDTPGAKITLSFIEDSVSPPENVFAVHTGSGGVIVVFDYPSELSVNHYEILVSDSISGNYIKWGRSEFDHSPAFLNNLPLGVTGFIRARAISNGGLASDWTQAKRGTLLYPSVTMECVAPSGSIILAGSIFTAKNPENDRLLAFQTNDEIIFTE